MKIVKVFSAITGVLAVIVSVPLIAAGIALVAWAGGSETTALPAVHVATDSNAVVADDIDIFAGDRHFLLPELDRVSVTITDDEPVFVGLAAPADVDRYLASGDGDPMSQDFWVYATEGRPADLDWDLQTGRWTAVVMNADGSDGVGATIQATIPSPPLRAAGAVLIVLGAGGGTVGLLLIGAAWATSRRPTTTAPAPTPTPTPTA